MNIVSNTGPLIALAKVDHLDLLNKLFGQVYIPTVVHRELLSKFGLEGVRLERALNYFVIIRPLAEIQPDVRVMTRYLDIGERDAIALASELNLPLVIDDRLGRLAAQRLNIPITGVVGVLIRAKLKNLIPSLREILEQMRDKGYWLSDGLIAQALQLSGE